MASPTFTLPSSAGSADCDVATPAALIGDPGRAAMLAALLDRRALPAGELARLARVGPATASAHLRKLVHGGLLVVEAHVRHRYFRLAGPGVARALEHRWVERVPASRALRVTNSGRRGLRRELDIRVFEVPKGE